MSIEALRDLSSGDELTFYYPSTEWEMDRPFDCWCGSEACSKKISGAKDMPIQELQKFRLSPHIKKLKGIN
jgi:hypothetical protein